MSRALRIVELSPDIRIERAKKLIAEAVGEIVEAQIAKGSAAAEWVDQAHSPLGRRRHCKLVKQGLLPGVRDGRRVLVRRSDLNRYLEERDGAAPEQGQTEGVDAMVASILRGKR